MNEEIRQELQQLEADGLLRWLRTIRGAQGARVTIDGKELLNLCSNNYLGIADHETLKQSSIKAVAEFGVGSGASRLVCGSMELHELLETRISRFKGTEATLVFNSGYAANTGVIPAVVTRGDFIYSDKLNHASIIDGAILSRAKLIRYPHNDMNSLRKLLLTNKAPGRRLIVTDAIFSMDGDIAPLRDLVSIRDEFGCVLMVDDAHGTGVFGGTGAGTAEMLGLSGSIDIQMGTLGKALGSFGAYVSGSRELVSLLLNRARSFIFSTSLPPSVLAASLAAIDLVDSDAGRSLREKLRKNSEMFSSAMSGAGFDTKASYTHIVPIVIGDASLTMEFTRQMLDFGIFVQGIRPPTVPHGTSRLRCTLMATHTEKDLHTAIEAFVRIGRKLAVI